MGLFGFGKKKEEQASQDAQQSPVSSGDSQGGPAPAAEAGDEMKKCEMCGETKLASEGKMMMEGTAFRCNDCAEKSEGDDHGEVCEFC